MKKRVTKHKWLSLLTVSLLLSSQLSMSVLAQELTGDIVSDASSSSSDFQQTESSSSEGVSGEISASQSEPTGSSSSSSVLPSSEEVEDTTDQTSTSTATIDRSSSQCEAATQTGSSTETGILYRLYHSGLKVHLYTRDANEYKVLGGRGWNQEGIAWQVNTQEGDIVYRLYHKGLQVHLYTKDTNEYKVLGRSGWTQEGPAFRSAGTLPIYRLYHSGLKRHLYTKDANEYKVLGQRGWNQEGIAFYGLGSSTTSIKNPPTTGSSTSSSSSSTSRPSSSSSSSSTSRPSSSSSTSSASRPTSSSSTSSTPRPSSSSTQASTSQKKPISIGYSYHTEDFQYVFSTATGKVNHQYGTSSLEDGKKLTAPTVSGFKVKSVKLEIRNNQTWTTVRDISSVLGGQAEVTYQQLASNPLKNSSEYYQWTVVYSKDTTSSSSTTSSSTTSSSSTKKPENKVEKTQRVETIPYTTQRTADATLWEDSQEVVQTKGKNGSRTIEVTTTTDAVTGKVTKTEKVLSEVKPTTEIIRYGTKKVTTTSSTTKTITLPYSSQQITDPNLETGKTETRTKGVNGVRTVRVITETNHRTGQVSTKEEVVSETKPTTEVIAIGTKPVSLLDRKTLTLDEFMSLTEEEQDAFIAKKGTVPGTTIRTGATKDTLEKVEQLINLDKLNAEFVKLLNTARAAEGLSAVTYAGQGSDAQNAATARANEMADHGSLRYQGTADGAHKRPDGSHWTTIYTAEQTARQGWRGENALQFGTALTARMAANETELASDLFDDWMRSAGHKAVMMKNLDNLQVAVGIGLNDKAIETTFNQGVTVAMLELVQPKP
ncbi:TPA: G5 domain-containing protein [Streptococcus suis]